MSAEDEEILKSIFQDKLPGYVAAGNVDGYVSLWADDCMWCPPNRPDERGKEAIRAAVGALLAENTIDPSFTADEIKVVESCGYVIGSSREIVTPKSGGPSTTTDTREFWIFVREDDWMISRMIFNVKPGP